jgi:hypothetical protein
MTERQTPYWKKCLEWFPKVTSIKIPRPYCANTMEGKKKHLMIFGDAGKEAMCTVAYMRILDENGMQIHVSFLGSKSYIVPLKQNRTIPELEMDVAAKSVEFQKLVKKHHSISFDETTYGTDNACVYFWITNKPNKPTIYINNRYNKIISGSRLTEWMWVPTEFQPADYGTKFDSMPELCSKNDWFQPRIFSLPVEKWLYLKPPSEKIAEQLHTHFKSKPEKSEVSRSFYNLDLYSDWKQPVRIAQILLKFIHVYVPKVLRIKREIKKGDKTEALKLQEKMTKHVQLIQSQGYLYYEAELSVIKDAQASVFSEEIKLLKKGAKLSTKMKLARFNPFLDERGVMRIETRLPESINYNNDKRNPKCYK